MNEAVNEAPSWRTDVDEKLRSLPEGKQLAEYLASLAAAMAPQGWTESNRMAGTELDGIPLRGDIEFVRADGSELGVYLLGDQADAESCKQTLVRTTLVGGVTAGLVKVARSGSLVCVGSGPSVKGVDRPTFDGWASWIEHAVAVPEFESQCAERQPQLDEVQAVTDRIGNGSASTSRATPAMGGFPTPLGWPSSDAAPSGSKDPFDALTKLGELHESGILTDAEFDGKKAELLSRL